MNKRDANNLGGGPPMIEMRSVYKDFLLAGSAAPVLRDIDLTIDRGEYVAIVGKSGSGKSTLLNMITGIDHPTRGSVRIRGVEVHTMDESRLAKWRGENVGIVFQFFQLIPTLTIEENLLLAMDFVNHVPARERPGRVQALLELVDIARHARKLPSALSGGEQQRAAIARALSNDPPLLVADEPTGNLDNKTAQSIQNVFQQLVKLGKTVVVVTHEKIGSSYDRVLSLADGVIVGDTKEWMKEAVR